MREIQPDQGAKTGERERDQHNRHRPRAAEKDQHQNGGEHGADHRFLDEIANRLAHVNRLVHHHVEVNAFDALEDRFELGFDSFNNRDRVCARLPVDRDVNLPLALHADDVRLDLMRIFDLRDIADVSWRTVADSERQIVELGDRRHHAVRVNLVIERPELGVASRDHHVEIANGVDDIERRKVSRLRLQRIDIGENAAQPPAVNRRRNHTGDRLQAVAQIEIGHVIKLGFIKRRARDADQTKRNRRGWIERHDHRRNRAGR